MLKFDLRRFDFSRRNSQIMTHVQGAVNLPFGYKDSSQSEQTFSKLLTSCKHHKCFYPLIDRPRSV